MKLTKLLRKRRRFPKTLVVMDFYIPPLTHFEEHSATRQELVQRFIIHEEDEMGWRVYSNEKQPGGKTINTMRLYNGSDAYVGHISFPVSTVFICKEKSLRG